MKTFLPIVLFLFVGCAQQNIPADAKPQFKTEKSSDDEEKWEVIVFDPQYETYLVSVARPKAMFSNAFLQARNQLLVSDWNSRYYSGRNPNFYEVAIDYDPQENYDLDFNYRLYQFFAYLNYRYGVNFQGLSGADKRR